MRNVSESKVAEKEELNINGYEIHSYQNGSGEIGEKSRAKNRHGMPCIRASTKAKPLGC